MEKEPRDEIEVPIMGIKWLELLLLVAIPRHILVREAAPEIPAPSGRQAVDVGAIRSGKCEFGNDRATWCDAWDNRSPLGPHHRQGSADYGQDHS
jgi:hypothetical protein